MTTQDQILADYQKKQQELDEQEESLKSYKIKGAQIIEETFYDIQHDVFGEEDNLDILYQARMELEHLEMTYQETLAKKMKTLNNQREENEWNYRKDSQSLSES